VSVREFREQLAHPNGDLSRLVGVVVAPLPIDSNGRAIWTAEAHHRDGKRFDVRAQEKLSLAKAFQKERQPVTEP
jgi:hypothetical protein